MVFGDLRMSLLFHNHILSKYIHIYRIIASALSRIFIFKTCTYNFLI